MENDERKTHVCQDCKARSPETDTNYTLISSRYGWRLSRRVEGDGTFVAEWRCPRCWEKHKRQKTMNMTPVDGVPFVRALPTDELAPSSARRAPEPMRASPTPTPAPARPSSTSSAPPRPRPSSAPPRAPKRGAK